MRKSKAPIILIILAIIAILAVVYSLWKIYKPSKMANNFEQINSSSTVASTTPSFEEKSFSDNNNFYEINAEYPVDSFDKEKDIETFVLYKVKEKQNDWKIGGEAYNSEQEIAKEFPDRPKMTYSYNISYERYESKDKETVSYVLNTYEFTGGAHGVNVINTFTFNQNGKLNIEDVLNISSKPEAIKLTKILAEKLRQKGGDMIVEDMMMQGLGLAYLKNDVDTSGFNFASNFENFYITNSGITFLFSQYHVAPYAAGIVTATIDWETLKPYLLNF